MAGASAGRPHPWDSCNDPTMTAGPAARAVLRVPRPHVSPQSVWSGRFQNPTVETGCRNLQRRLQFREGQVSILDVTLAICTPVEAEGIDRVRGTLPISPLPSCVYFLS